MDRRLEALERLSPGAKVHVSGICGTGMAQIALLLQEEGYIVSGSDKAFYPPIGPMIRSRVELLFEDYAAQNIAPDCQLVVIGNSLSRGNPEVEHVLEKGIPYVSMPEILGKVLIGDHQHCATSVVVAGTHGKTTTSAAIAVMLEKAGRRPGFFIAGAVLDLPQSIRAVSRDFPPKDRVVVLEGDEYDSAFFAKWAKFRSYRPDIGVITSIEFDHADIYESIEAIVREFQFFAESLPSEGQLLCFSGSSVLRESAQQWKAPVAFYGHEETDTYRLLCRRPQKGGGQEISVLLQDEKLDFSTPLSGEHNALNLLAAAAIGQQLGLSTPEIAAGLSQFRGVQRRQQELAFRGDIRVIEDFAHHPTAVRLTLEGLREQYPEGRLIAVFEPRSNTSRRNFFQEQYVSSFDAADLAVLQEVSDAGGYQKGDQEIRALNVLQLTRDIGRRGLRALSLPNPGSILDFLKQEVQPGDTVVIMSNGSFGGLMAEFGSFVQAR